LKIDKKLSVCLAIDKVLGNDIVRPTTKAFIRNRLNFESEVKVAQIFEGNGRHSDLIFFCWYLDDGSILISLKEIFNAEYLRNLAFGVDWKGNWYQALKLNFQKSLNRIVFPHWWDFDSDLDLGAFFLSNFESNLFKIFKSFVASD
jgi:hypothetical protein